MTLALCCPLFFLRSNELWCLISHLLEIYPFLFTRYATQHTLSSGTTDGSWRHLFTLSMWLTILATVAALVAANLWNGAAHDKRGLELGRKAVSVVGLVAAQVKT